jgi:hypothetical protein
MISRRDFLRVTTAAALGSQIARLRQDVRAYAREVEAPAATPPAARTPLGLAAELGLVLDPWQERALATDCHHRVLLVTRQGGKGVVDLFAQARTSDRLRFAGVELAAITITGGTAVTEDGEGFRVPKRDLASAVQALLQEERVKVAPALPLARTLLDELVGFRVKIDRATGHDSYGAGEDWRSAPHDDLVLALAMALWWGEWRARVADGGSVDVTEQLRAAPPEQSRSVVWGGASGA